LIYMPPTSRPAAKLHLDSPAKDQMIVDEAQVPPVPRVIQQITTKGKDDDADSNSGISTPSTAHPPSTQGSMSRSTSFNCFQDEIEAADNLSSLPAGFMWKNGMLDYCQVSDMRVRSNSWCADLEVVEDVDDEDLEPIPVDATHFTGLRIRNMFIDEDPMFDELPPRCASCPPVGVFYDTEEEDEEPAEEPASLAAPVARVAEVVDVDAQVALSNLLSMHMVGGPEAPSEVACKVPTSARRARDLEAAALDQLLHTMFGIAQ